MTRINTNVVSLNAQKTLRRSNQSLQLALTRLSTGLRINTGKDDPAGLIGSEVLRTSIVSVQRAITNNERANQLIATAESALSQVNALLNDIRGLVSEAANTGALSQEQIAANQLQIDSSLEAIDRIAQITTFQGRKLLDGSLDFITSGVDTSKVADLKIDQANFGSRSQINVSIDIVQQATKGRLTFKGGAIASDVVLEVSGANGTEVFNFASGSKIEDIATAVNLVADATGVEAQVGKDATKGSVTISSYGLNNDIVITANEAGYDAGNIRVKYSLGDSTATTATFTEGASGEADQIEVKLQTTAAVKAEGIVDDAVAAKLETDTGTGDANAKFVLTAVEAGTSGNNIQLVINSQDNQGQGVEVAVSGNVITVTLDTDAANGGANAKQTAADLVAAINNNVDARELVTAALAEGSDGSGTLNTIGATNLSGGADTANNEIRFKAKIASDDFTDISVNYVDANKITDATFTNVTLDYQSGPVKARAALKLPDTDDNIILTATKAGTEFNDVTIRFSTAAFGTDKANVYYDASKKELVLEIDSAGNTTMGTLKKAINDEGTFTVSDGSESVNNASVLETSGTNSVVGVTANTSKSGSDGKTLFVYIDAGTSTAADVVNAVGTPPDAATRRVAALFTVELDDNTGAGVVNELAKEKVITGGQTGGKIVATANDVVNAINSSAAGAKVTASLAAGNNGYGKVTLFDRVAYAGDADKNNRLQFLAPENAPKIRFVSKAGQKLGLDLTTDPPQEGFASVVIQAANANATLKFTAKQKGAEFDGITIQYVDDGTVAAGQEQVLFDRSKKRLIIKVDSGNTTANQVIAAINNDEFVSTLFKAENYGSSTGAGAVQTTDTDLNNEKLNLKTSGGLIDPGTLIINLETDSDGLVKTTAKDIVDFFDDPSKFITDSTELAKVQDLLDQYGVSVSLAEGSDGTGLVDPTTSDVTFSTLGVTYTDAQPTGRTYSVNGQNAQLEFTALQAGTEYDGVKVVFVDDATVTQGTEKAEYDAATKTLTFRIDEGNTTAQDIFNIFKASHSNYDANIASLFKASLVGTGGSVITTDDTATLTGGQVTSDTPDGAALLGNSDAAETGLSFVAAEYGSQAFVQVKALSGTFTLVDDSGNVAERSAGQDVKARVNGIEAVGSGLTLSVNTSALDLTLTVTTSVSTGDSLNFSILGGGALFQLGPDVVSNQQARLGIQAVNTARLGAAAGKLFELRSGGAKSLLNDPTGAARVVEEAITQITSLRGRLGAFQKTTLETNIFSLSDTLENLTEAESSIRDADFAAESAALTRAQILVQSGTSVLAIANSNPQNVLALLR